jgi:uncharacterized protein YndB with AHSA1/START domain
VSRNEIVVDAPPEAVWEVLADPWLYTQWVVGNKRIRGVEAAFPAVGSRFHHTLRGGLLTVRGHTRVVAVERGRRLELDARMWPLGHAHVIVEVEPCAGGTRVTMVEDPTSGPVKLLETRLMHGVAHGRNKEALRRLRRLSEQRWRRSRP